jgi:hypothetical protein
MSSYCYACLCSYNIKAYLVATTVVMCNCRSEQRQNIMRQNFRPSSSRSSLRPALCLGAGVQLGVQRFFFVGLWLAGCVCVCVCAVCVRADRKSVVVVDLGNWPTNCRVHFIWIIG